MKKLSKTQKLALLKCTGNWQTAYDVQVSLATLDALRERELLQRKVTMGYMYSPRTAIFYKLTEAGHKEKAGLRDWYLEELAAEELEELHAGR